MTWFWQRRLAYIKMEYVLAVASWELDCFSLLFFSFLDGMMVYDGTFPRGSGRGAWIRYPPFDVVHEAPFFQCVMPMVSRLHRIA